jgi:predicted transcriptional regulator
MKKSGIGEKELALLTFLAEGDGATVREAAASFGEARGLARSTVLTMMERLRKKGHLERRLVDGVYHYSSRASSGDVLRDVVKGFVERTLGGSVSPFVAYLTTRATVSREELAELEALVDSLRTRAPRRKR